MRIAFIHDWLWGMRGGERCLEELLRLFPDSEIFTLFYGAGGISAPINEKKIHVSSLSSLPKVSGYYRHLLPLYPLATKELSKKLSEVHRNNPFDVVISVSHCAAKNVWVPDDVLHLCYCLTPVRYLWDHYESYFSKSKLEPLIRIFAKYLRHWDRRGSVRVDQFVGISNFIRDRIKRVYARDADVIYPPVRSDWLDVAEGKGGNAAFLMVNALVPYKNTDLVIEAFNKLNLPLTIVGQGPEEGRLKRLAGPNITFKKMVAEAELARLYRDSRALVFAANEDFGMTPVEMLASGKPVIALAKGGALETVDRSCGVRFCEENADSISEAVLHFLDIEDSFTIEGCVAKAGDFSVEAFDAAIFELFSRLGYNVGPSEQKLVVNSQA